MKAYLKYANGMNAGEDVLNWIQTVLKNKLKKESKSQTEVEHIIDYLVSSSAPPRLGRMSYKEALSNTEKWNSANQKKGRDLVDTPKDIEPFKDVSGEMRIVKLVSKKAYEREGYLMRHCLGGYDVNSDIEIYSLRDKGNNPHATFEIRKSENEITQIKGKGNGSIHPKYIEPVLDFLKAMDQEIRPHDMQNLGYYHIDEIHLDFVKQIQGVELIEIRGGSYVFTNA